MTSNNLMKSLTVKGPRFESDESRRVQVKDLYCLTRFESEIKKEELSVKD